MLCEVDVIPPSKDPRQSPTTHDNAASTKKIGASKQYGAKEKTREKVQAAIAKKVNGGGISSDDDLKRYLEDPERVKQDGQFDDDEDVELAITALKMVPVSVWKSVR